MTDDFYPLDADKTFLVSQKALVIQNGKYSKARSHKNHRHLFRE